MQPIVTMEDVCFGQCGHRILEHITWTLERGARWAVLGPNGAGKSTFLRLVRGDAWPDQGRGGVRLYHLDGAPSVSPIGVRRRLALVSAELQQGYARNEWRVDGETVVLSGVCDTPLLYEPPGPDELRRAQRAMELLGLEALRRMPVLSMSQGQMRRVLIARALASDPAALLLDEVCDGLDEAARAEVLATVERLAAADPPVALLFATHRAEEIPACVDQGLVVGPRACGGGSTLLYAGAVAGAVERVFAPISASGGSAVPTGGWGTAGACSPGLQGVTGDMAARDWARAQIRPPQRGREERRGPEPPSVEVRRALGRTPLVEIVDADVYLERRRVLTRINWTVRPGERWAVLGPNGAGKSTLCGLVLGDLRPALGGMVRHFGVQGGELRAVQKRMGYVSAALQAAYVQPLTGAELVLSGFFASRGLYPLVERATEAQHAAVARWLEHFGLADLAGRPIAALSYGQMRRLLLARAAVAGPDLLVLDEPCSGLDAPSREAFLATLSGLARQGAAMVFVTHHPDELIPEIDHVLRLENGRIAAIAHEHPASGGRAGDAPNGMGADGAAS